MAKIVDVSARRERVSEAVFDVLAQRGLAQLSLRAVAEAADCTTGMVLHYFRDRKALLTHARRLLYDRMLTRVLVAQAATADPRQALRDVLAQALTLDAERAAEARVWVGFLAAVVDDQDLAGQHITGNRAWQDRITELVRAATSGGTRTEAVHIAQLLVALTGGLAALSVADPEGFPAERQQQLVDHAMDALVPATSTSGGSR